MTHYLKHREDIDTLTWEEFYAWGEEVITPEFFINHADENETVFTYKQQEFPDYGKSLCTIYWPMTALSIMLGRELTTDERLEMVKRRYTQPDFVPTYGWFTSIGVDVARRWYNELNADKFVTFFVTDSKLIQKLAQKKIPLVTSVRMNKEYIGDSIDGVMDKLNYWVTGWTRYGHCRTRYQLEILDHYWRTYKYRNLNEMELVMNNGYEAKSGYIFVRESELSETGKLYLKWMRAKLWNWQRANDAITRFEAFSMASKLNPLTPTNKIWNWKDKDKKATIFEVTVMLSKTSKVPVYMWTDRNKEVTRGDVVKMIYSV